MCYDIVKLSNTLLPCYSSLFVSEAAMSQSEKKRYEKPTLRKVKLDAKCAVLGFCKTTGKIGPGNPGCAVGASRCLVQGS